MAFFQSDALTLFKKCISGTTSEKSDTIAKAMVRELSEAGRSKLLDTIVESVQSESSAIANLKPVGYYVLSLRVLVSALENSIYGEGFTDEVRNCNYAAVISANRLLSQHISKVFSGNEVISGNGKEPRQMQNEPPSGPQQIDSTIADESCAPSTFEDSFNSISAAIKQNAASRQESDRQRRIVAENIQKEVVSLFNDSRERLKRIEEIIQATCLDSNRVIMSAKDAIGATEEYDMLIDSLIGLDGEIRAMSLDGITDTKRVNNLRVIRLRFSSALAEVGIEEYLPVTGDAYDCEMHELETEDLELARRLGEPTSVKSISTPGFRYNGLIIRRSIIRANFRTPN